jgi:phosphotransferase system HPr-like phosphotransfer protein
MAGNRKTNRYNGGKANESRVVDALDDLAEYERFKAEILPKLRKMMRDGKSAEEIYNFSQGLLAARAVTIAASSPDEKTALQAIKEVLDRGVGKAADRLEVTQRYEKLSTEELEALLKSQEEDLQDEAEPRSH